MIVLRRSDGVCVRDRDEAINTASRYGVVTYGRDNEALGDAAKFSCINEALNAFFVHIIAGGYTRSRDDFMWTVEHIAGNEGQ